MKKVRLTLVTAFIGLFLMSSMALADRFREGGGEGFKSAQFGGHGKPGGSGLQMILRNAEEIDLTDEQQDQLFDMREAFQLKQIDQKAEIQKAQVKLRSLKRSEDASESEVLKAIDKVGALKTEMKKMSYKQRTAIREVLSQEQRDKLKSIMKERRFGFSGHGESKGRGRRMGGR